MKPKIIVITVLTLLFLIILGQNAHVVNVRLLFWRFDVSQIILILFLLLIGFAMGYLTSELLRMRKNYRV